MHRLFCMVVFLFIIVWTGGIYDECSMAIQVTICSMLDFSMCN